METLTDVWAVLMFLLGNFTVLASVVTWTSRFLGWLEEQLP